MCGHSEHTLLDFVGPAPQPRLTLEGETRFAARVARVLLPRSGPVVGFLALAAFVSARAFLTVPRTSDSSPVVCRESVCVTQKSAVLSGRVPKAPMAGELGKTRLLWERRRELAASRNCLHRL